MAEFKPTRIFECLPVTPFRDPLLLVVTPIVQTLNTVYKPQLYTEIHHGEYQGGWIECRARRISLELLLVVLQTPILGASDTRVARGFLNYQGRVTLHVERKVLLDTVMTCSA